MHQYSATPHVVPMKVCEQELPVTQYFDVLPPVTYITNCGEQKLPLYRCWTVH